MEPAQLERTIQGAFDLADQGREDAAWAAVEPVVAVAEADVHAARALAGFVTHGGLDRERRLDLGRHLLERWPEDVEILSALGQATQTLVELVYLNNAPPSDPLFEAVATGLRRALEEREGVDRIRAALGLEVVARICGRRWDEACERAHRLLLEVSPPGWHPPYNYGLFLKTRGRFAESVAANRSALAQGGDGQDCVLWNLGIAATGCGDGQTALEVWRGLGCNLELGPDGLPRGGWAPVQVRLAERPVAERGPDDDDPGLEETIWVERLSPCHGRIRSALYQDLGVDYGDLVLFDGAPIITRRWGDQDVPVFPHLATIRREGWHVLPFAATQQAQGQVAALGARLGDEVELYVHTEMFRAVCQACWQQEEQGHAHEDRAHRTVTGKLVFPPDADPRGIGEALDRALASGGVRVFLPDLWAGLGETRRAEVERRRYDLLAGGRAVDARET